MKHTLSPRSSIKLKRTLIFKIGVSTAVVATLSIIFFIIFNSSPSIQGHAMPSLQSGHEYILSFNGEDADLKLNNPDFQLRDSLTVSCMVRWDTIPSNGKPSSYLLACNSSSNTNIGQFWLYHNSNNSKFAFAISTNTGRKVIYSKTIPQKNVWYHVCGTYDGVSMKFFINGIEEARSLKDGALIPNSIANNFKLVIGASAQSSYNYRRFKGSICRISLFDKALNTYEINQLKCSGASTVPHYKPIADFYVDQTDSTNLKDRSSHQFIIPYNNVKIHQIPNIDCFQLPVTLTHFSALKTSENTTIRWSTTSELNNDYFILEKSMDGETFFSIGSIEGAGNSNQPNDYTFYDTGESNTQTLYQLHQIDYDGTKKTYGPIEIQSEEQKTGIFTVYPNPLKKGQNIVIEGITNNDQILFTDLNGRIFTESNLLPAGIFYISINGSFETTLIVIP